MLDATGLYRLLQLMHICKGGDKALLGGPIKVRWMGLFSPQAKIGGELAKIEKVEGTVVLGEGEYGEHFPLCSNVSCLTVERTDGVKVAVPYSAFLCEGVEVEFELPR